MAGVVAASALACGVAFDTPAAAADLHGFLSLFSWGDTTFGPAGHRVEGSGNIAQQVRAVDGFGSLTLDGPVHVILKQADSEKVSIRADDNILALIETRVDNGQLKIGPRAGSAFRTGHPIIATVEVRHLNGLTVNGSGDVSCSHLVTDLLEVTLRGSGNVNIEQLQADTLAVLLQGSGDLRLGGTVPQQGIVIEGSGDVSADDLAGRRVAVRIAGSGDAEVRASEALTVEISGSGDVVYRGQPKVTHTGHGSGDLVHR
jgi:hypothetical protein